MVTIRVPKYEEAIAPPIPEGLQRGQVVSYTEKKSSKGNEMLVWEINFDGCPYNLSYYTVTEPGMQGNLIDLALACGLKWTGEEFDADLCVGAYITCDVEHVEGSGPRPRAQIQRVLPDMGEIGSVTANGDIPF